MFVLQIVAPFSNSSAPLFSCAASSDAISAASASMFAAVITPKRVSAIVRRFPLCSSRRLGIDQASESNSAASGTTAISQTHPGRPINFQPPKRLTTASVTCSAMTSPTPDVASNRDSTCSSRSSVVDTWPLSTMAMDRRPGRRQPCRR